VSVPAIRPPGTVPLPASSSDTRRGGGTRVRVWRDLREAIFRKFHVPGSPTALPIRKFRAPFPGPSGTQLIRFCRA